MALKMQIVPLKEAQPITKQADEAKHYNFVLQLGCRSRWRGYIGGAWRRDPAGDEGNGQRWKHVPAIHKVGPVTGSVVNSFIAKHNRFLKANRERVEPDGDVGRMTLVLGFEETKPPALKRAPLPFDLEAMISRISESAATAAVNAVMKSGK